MKEMDMEILSKEEKQGEGEEEEERKGLEMTDVVPVGGLIMARYVFVVIWFSFFLFSFLAFLDTFVFRFHMQEVEHSTAVDMWGHKLIRGEIKRSTSFFLFFHYFFFFIFTPFLLSPRYHHSKCFPPEFDEDRPTNPALLWSSKIIF